MSDINVKMAELDEATVRPGVVRATIEDLELTDKHVIIELRLPLGEKLSFPVERPEHYWSDDIDFVRFLNWYDYSSSNLSMLPGEQVLIDMSGDEPAIIPPRLRSSDDWFLNMTEPIMFLWSVVLAGAATGVVAGAFSPINLTGSLVGILVGAGLTAIGSAIVFFLSLGAILLAGIKITEGGHSLPEITPVAEASFNQEDITDYADKEKVPA